MTIKIKLFILPPYYPALACHGVAPDTKLIPGEVFGFNLNYTTFPRFILFSVLIQSSMKFQESMLRQPGSSIMGWKNMM